MAFYHFLAIFPSLLVFFAVGARIPHFGPHLRGALGQLSTQVLPQPVASLFGEMIDELNKGTAWGVQLITVGVGAIWAALNGTWAMVYGLDNAYEVEERRSWWNLSVTIVGLTITLAIAGAIAVFLIFCSGYIQAEIHGGAIALRILEWMVVAATLSFSFAILYRFAPSVRDHEWRWSTPGAVCAVVLWIGSTLVARFYFEHVNNYSRSYGHLNSVVMLLLWLYVTNGAILIGGEMNSEIEKAGSGRGKNGEPAAEDETDPRSCDAASSRA